MKRFTCAVTVAAATLWFVIGASVPASAAVLVNHTPARVCVGKTIKVGVWYQQTGGWYVRAALPGTYQTVYYAIYGGKWHSYRLTTKAVHC